MRSWFGFALVAIVALAAKGPAQEVKKEPAKVEMTKAMYMIKGLH